MICVKNIGNDDIEPIPLHRTQNFDSSDRNHHNISLYKCENHVQGFVSFSDQLLIDKRIIVSLNYFKFLKV